MSVIVEELTRADCRERKFTGLRSDRILLNCEIWKEGILVADISAEDMKHKPHLFIKAYALAFGLYEDQVVLPSMWRTLH